MGKVSQSRAFLLRVGLLVGEMKTGPSGQKLWHLAVPDLWEDNMNWVKRNPSIIARVKYKVEQRVHIMKPSPDEAPVNKKPSPDETKNIPSLEKPSPPPKAAEKVSVSALLRGTLTKGEDEREESALAAYIGQNLNHVPPGQQNKLALGYTEQLQGGNQRKHPSPDELWKQHPLYPQYVEEQLAYFKGQSGSPAARRSKLINSLCKYKSSPYAWLEWLERHGGAQDEPEVRVIGIFPQHDQTPITPEEAAELAAWAEEEGRKIRLPL